MKFRTEIEQPTRQPLQIAHADPITMLGSCFTDNVGELLARDGFDVVHNPMGPLYNPASIRRAIELALTPRERRSLCLRSDDVMAVHCLDFASKYTAPSRQLIEDRVNDELDKLSGDIRRSKYLILTLGTAYVFSLSGDIVGNCHKFPSNVFTRTRLSVDDAIEHLRAIIDILPTHIKVIFTVSPIRHTADTLHGNQLSKATLQLAVDDLIGSYTADSRSTTDGTRLYYFPAYEIMLDDLRDYRFYAADMKHPSPVAVDYIYEIFTQYYFDKDTVDRARQARRISLSQAHRPILS